MNPIPEPAELHEAECNAQGLYGLPAAAFGRAGDREEAVPPRAAAPVEAQPQLARDDDVR